MGFLDRVTSWFRTEVRDVREAVDRVEQDLDADLSRRERELTATPEERLAMIQEESAGDDLLAEVQAKIDGQQAKADANAELLDDPPPDDPPTN